MLGLFATSSMTPALVCVVQFLAGPDREVGSVVQNHTGDGRSVNLIARCAEQRRLVARVVAIDLGGVIILSGAQSLACICRAKLDIADEIERE